VLCGGGVVVVMVAVVVMVVEIKVDQRGIRIRSFV
jgi:hypothetical protein